MPDFGPLYRMAYRMAPLAVQVRLRSRRPPGASDFWLQIPGGERLFFHGMDQAVFLRHLFWLGFDGTYPDFTRIFQALSISAESVIDLGSYLGYYALIAARMNPSARVFSVEPLPESVNYQEQLFKLNGIGTVTVCPVGVAKTSGVVPFFVPDHSLSRIPNIGSLTNRFGPGTFYEDRGSNSLDITVLSLPDLMEKFEIGHVDLIKFFVEEMEADVFEGGEPILQKWKPDLVGWIFFRDDSVVRLGSMLGALEYKFFALRGADLVRCPNLQDARERGDVFNPDKGGRSAVLATATPERALGRIRKDHPEILVF